MFRAVATALFPKQLKSHGRFPSWFAHVRNVFDPAHPGTRVYGRGDAYLRAGLYAEAASDFTEAIRAYDDGTAEAIREKTKDSKGPDPLRRSREQLETLLAEAEKKLDEKSKQK